jgi:hypothetical protein
LVVVKLARIVVIVRRWIPAAKRCAGQKLAWKGDRCG